ncbi:MAG: hypothetical protein HQL48_05185 [Gammaproteobacteria bacterium]|nr:hypothetical protein [Gammaproteobacteria bacterium]
MSPLRQSQQGTVLVMSLLILFVMTMMVVTSTETVTIDEKMSYNYQLATIAFRTAESLNEDTINLTTPTHPGYSVATDPAVQVMVGGSYSVNHDSDSRNFILSEDDSATITVTQNGASGFAEGFSLNFMVIPFQLQALATTGGGVTSTHVQAIDRLAPAM